MQPTARALHVRVGDSDDVLAARQTGWERRGHTRDGVDKKCSAAHMLCTRIRARDGLELHASHDAM